MDGTDSDIEESTPSIDKNVPRTCVKNWSNQKMQLEFQLQRPCSSSSDKRLHGAGRPLKDADFDKKLIAWVREQRAMKFSVSRTLIQKQALAFSSDSTYGASNGWLVNFLNRHNLVSRRPTTTCQKKPEHYVEKLTNFLVFVEKCRRKTNYQYIFASDETAVYLDGSNSLTVEEKGIRRVSVKTVGHEKLHVTVMLTARSDGFKCQQFVLLKNKRPIKHI